MKNVSGFKNPMDLGASIKGVVGQLLQDQPPQSRCRQAGRLLETINISE
jgi:hypothetical protein